MSGCSSSEQHRMLFRVRGCLLPCSWRWSPPHGTGELDLKSTKNRKFVPELCNTRHPFTSFATYTRSIAIEHAISWPSHSSGPPWNLHHHLPSQQSHPEVEIADPKDGKWWGFAGCSSPRRMANPPASGDCGDVEIFRNEGFLVRMGHHWHRKKTGKTIYIYV